MSATALTNSTKNQITKFNEYNSNLTTLRISLSKFLKQQKNAFPCSTIMNKYSLN